MNAPRRPSRRRLDGVLLLDKPLGMSSNTALQVARRLFNAAKAGHTGTLDPLATGLLPLCFGEATKFAGELLDADKAYDACIRLGVTTTTADAEGEVLETRPVLVDAAQVAEILPRFAGEISQVPPMYSALKRDGKALYEYARAGVEIERQARRVTIHEIRLNDFQGEHLSLSVSCSKGTYIRTLAEDIGHALGCGAHLAALRRTRIGALTLAQVVTLEQIEAASGEGRDALLSPADSLLNGLPRVELDEAQTKRFMQGQALPHEGPAGRHAVYGRGRFLGLADRDGAGLLKPRRLVSAGGDDDAGISS